MLSVCRVTDTRGCGSGASGLYTRGHVAYSPLNVFDVLVYLYENYGALHACPDADSLAKRLTAAGFDDDEISEALAWLSGLEQVTQESIAVGPESNLAFRVYAAVEVDRLGSDAIGFLSFLEHAGQLTPTQREIVIERALATTEIPIDLETLKVIVLMVLWSQQADIDVLLLEELLDDGEARPVH
jgi:Smg protein